MSTNRSLAFENVNLECKKIRGSLKVRSAPVDEWILQTINIESFEYITKSCVGEAISKGMKRRQNDKYFNCCRIGHLRRDCRQEFLGIIFLLGMPRIGGLSLQVYVEGVTKANTGPMNADQQKIDKATQYHWETPWRTSHRPQATKSKVVQSFPVTGGHVSPEKLKTPSLQ